MKNTKLFSLPILLWPMLALLSAGAHAKNPTVIVVTASCPGATVHAVADLIAAPLEQQLNQADELTRLESISSRDGNYIAHLFFDSKADPAELQQRVQNCVDLAKPNLPEGVLINNIFTKPEKPNELQTQVTLALIDRENQGWEHLKKCAEEVLKPLSSAKAINNPTAFPIEEKQLTLQADREKQLRLGVSTADLLKAMPPNARELKIEELQKLTVSDKHVPLTQFVEFKEELAPSAVFRVNRFHAIRITGAVNDGTKVSEAATKCTELAEAELKLLQRDGFSVVNLSD